MKLRDNTFYPEIIGRIENDEFNSLKLDNGEIIKLNFDNIKGDELEEIINTISNSKINQNFIAKKLKEIKKNKEIKKEIRQEIYKEYPELKNITPDDEEEFERLNELMEEKLSEKAKEIAFKENKLKKGGIIKIAGIIKKENNNYLLNSKSIIKENNGFSAKGLYFYSVINRKVIINITQTKNKKPVVSINQLINIEQLKEYFRNQEKTIESYISEKVKLRGKEYKLNKLSKPYITYYENNDFKLHKLIKEIINIINSDYNEEIRISDDLLLKFKENFNVSTFNSEAEKIYYAFKLFQKYILDKIEKNFNILRYITIYIPLGIKEEEYLNALKVVLYGNKSGKEGRLGIIDSLLNTTFRLYKENEVISKKIKELIQNKFNELYENKSLKLISTYNVDNITYVGFFPQNINLQNSVLSIDNYTTIIEYVYKNINFNKKAKND